MTRLINITINKNSKKIFKKFSVIAKLKSRNIRATGSTEPEAVDDDEADGNNQKQKNGRKRWREQRPRLPFS
mgnify:CR=1 FL=1